MGKGETRYSDRIRGSAGNYNWPVVFSETDGYVNIMQAQDKDTDSVLLSPAQVNALLAFLGVDRHPGAARRHRVRSRS
jgi:hypothetical protein